MIIRPILNAMMRNKVSVLLISLQIAITLAIVTNAMFIIDQRSTLMQRPSGIDEDNTFYLQLSGVSDDYNAENELQADLNLMRNMPGIVDVSTVNTVPLSGSGRNSHYSQEAGENPDESLLAAEYFFDDHFLNASGIKLIEGDNFKFEDMNYIPASGEKVSYTKVIITKAFAEATFGKEQDSYIGKHLYSGDFRALTVIGVVDTLQAPWATASFIEHSIIIPLNYNSRYQRFMIRTETGKRDQMIPAVVESLRSRNPQRIIREPKSFTELRYNSYRNDMAMNSILTSIVFILMAITSFGIVGLVSFNVNQRKKQIGTRRALGARRIDIILYFMTENWLMTTIGLLVGSVMTYLLNYWLVEMYAMQKIDWYYLPAGILTLLVLGQLAVFFPARRAASISPAIATRSV